MINLDQIELLNCTSQEELEVFRQQTLEFATAVINKDLMSIESLLPEGHTYFGEKNKLQTLEYFKEQFEKPIPAEFMTEDVKFFYCHGCQPGNPALLFHSGCFPVLEEGDRPKAITLAFKDGKISDLALCYGFCNERRLKRLAKRN